MNIDRFATISINSANLLKGLIQLSDEKAKKAISNYIKLDKLFIT